MELKPSNSRQAGPIRTNTIIEVEEMSVDQSNEGAHSQIGKKSGLWRFGTLKKSSTSSPNSLVKPLSPESETFYENTSSSPVTSEHSLSSRSEINAPSRSLTNPSPSSASSPLKVEKRRRSIFSKAPTKSRNAGDVEFKTLNAPSTQTLVDKKSTLFAKTLTNEFREGDDDMKDVLHPEFIGRLQNNVPPGSFGSNNGPRPLTMESRVATIAVSPLESSQIDDGTPLIVSSGQKTWLPPDSWVVVNPAMTSTSESDVDRSQFNTQSTGGSSTRDADETMVLTSLILI